MKKIYLGLLICLLSITSHAQFTKLDWAKSIGGISDEAGYSITVDGAGNLYVAGTFEDTVDFDPGAGTFYLSSNGIHDAFVQKLDASGNFIWAISIGGIGDDSPQDVTIDAAGNVHVIGRFQYTVDFDPGAGTFNLIATWKYDIFVLKLDAAGNFIWAGSMGGPDYHDTGQSVSVDPAGNVYAVGYYFDTADLDPGAPVLNFTSNGGFDIFIEKLDTAGNLIWVKSIGGIQNDKAWAVITDTLGNLYVSGAFYDTVDFDPGAGIFNLISNGWADAFVLKLDTGGNFIWARAIGGPLPYNGESMTFGTFGNVYITGAFQGAGDFDPGAAIFNLSSKGSGDIFILKLDTGGNFIWANSTGGVTGDMGLCVTTDTSGNLLLTGIYGDTVDFDPGIGVFELISNGGNDAFIQKLDTGGNLIWAKSLGGTGQDQALSIVVDASGNEYLTGFYNDTADFDPSLGTYYLTPDSLVDFFIVKLSPCAPSTGIDVIIACDSFTWINSVTYTSTTNNATATLHTYGCDSIVTLNLTILNSSYSTDSIASCDSITWIDGNTYTSNDSTSTDTLVNAVGCDSVVTLYLTLTKSTAGIDTITNCDSIIWIDGKTYTSSNDTATYILTNAIGCDSVITLNLTIDNKGIDTINACDSITWINGITYTSNNNTATDTLLNAAGCDSVVTLDLTLYSPNSVVDTITACDSFTWIDGNTYNTNNNTAMHTLFNAGGCDSIVTLNLTIYSSNSGVDTIAACDSITWIDGSTYTSNNNIATDTLTNAAGCDSVVTLNLTINTVDVSVTTTDPTITANTSAATYQWLDCNSNYAIMPGDTAQIFTASANGDYAVEVTQNGCTDTSACSTISSFSIVKNTFLNRISISPNPSHGPVIIDLGDLREVSIKVYTTTGQLIYQAENIMTSIYRIEITEVQGVYFIEVSSQGEKQHFKLVKM
ncbi:MAG: SBBP repeat-containing protein [Bacteroidetes bacterium]|nr:SBBP repeat-containing protein [Bacteroidota bacterium]